MENIKNTQKRFVMKIT